MKKIILLLLLLGQAFAFELEDVINSMDELSFGSSHSIKTILTNAEGLTVYTFDEDEEGISNCHGRCLRVWPPVLTEAEELPLPFSIVVRENGEKQIALNSRPLYLFFNDTQPGETRGDGLGGVWHLIKLQ